MILFWGVAIIDKLTIKTNSPPVKTRELHVLLEVMGKMTDLKYKDKIQELMKEYHLGYSRIEDTINMEED